MLLFCRSIYYKLYKMHGTNIKIYIFCLKYAGCNNCRSHNNVRYLLGPMLLKWVK